MLLQKEIVRQVLPSELTPGQVGREFRKLIDAGAVLRAAGDASDDPLGLLSMGYTPRHKLRLFDTTYYLANLRSDESFRFYVAYVLQEGSDAASSRRDIHARIFYKDSSLVWRSPTHVIRSEDDNWIGKGDLKTFVRNGQTIEYSAEETTNLPLEIQAALDVISRRAGHVRRDDHAVELVLRSAPDGRFEPYQDFIAPRRKAASDDRNLVNHGDSVAWFTRENDPASLHFAAGFEPDFARGILDVSDSRSRLYGGAIRKFRILSRNREIQYQFIAAPRQVWIIPPQALTTEIMSYGVRTVDVDADEDLCVPGYEYHFMDESEDPPRLYSQIPEGYAGEASEVDGSRADASPWLEKLPVIQDFRRMVPLSTTG